MSRHSVEVHQLRADGMAYLNVMDDAAMAHTDAVGVWTYGFSDEPIVALRCGSGNWHVVAFGSAEARDAFLAAEPFILRTAQEVVWLVGAPAALVAGGAAPTDTEDR